MELAKNLDLIQDNNTDDMVDAITKLVDQHPNEAAAYRSGKKQLLGFFMGQLMRMEGVKANPKLAKEVMMKILNA